MGEEQKDLADQLRGQCRSRDRIVVTIGFPDAWSFLERTELSLDALDHWDQAAGDQKADAIFWKTSEVPRARLEQARGCLEEAGRLVIVAAPQMDPKSYRGFNIASAEAGFIVQKEVLVPAGDRYEAAQVLTLRKDSCRIRGYEEGDERAILPLFKACFYVDRSVEHWKWKFVDNPYGRLNMSMAFDEDGRLVAQQSGYPIPFWNNLNGSPETFCSMQMGDMMTDPSVRQKGLGATAILPRMDRHYQASYDDGTLGFNYGFNTGSIFTIMRRHYDAHIIEPITYRVLEKARLTEPKKRWFGYSVKPLTRDHLPELDDLFCRAAPDYRYLVQKDGKYAAWRYLDCPDGGFTLLGAFRGRRLAGWSAFSRKEDRLVWGDALFERRHAKASHDVLKQACEEEVGRDQRTIVGWYPPWPAWWSNTLDDLGFEKQEEPNKLMSIYRPLKIRGVEDYEQRMQQLYYTMGDSDLF